MKFLRFAALAILATLGHPLAGLPAFAATTSQLQTRARSLALDVGSSRQRYTDATILIWLNEAQRFAVTDAKPLLKSGSFELVVGSTYYAMPSDFLQAYRVSLDFDVLEETTPEALDRQDRWQETSAEPTHYFIHWASRTKMGVYPWPESSGSTGTVRYEYYAQVTDLSAAGDSPFNGVTELSPYHDSLAYYAAARMSALDGRTDLAVLYMAEFRAGVERMGREARMRPVYRPAASAASRDGPNR